MLKPSATKTALVIAVLATPALAGSGKPNLKPAAVAKLDKAVAPLAPLPVKSSAKIELPSAGAPSEAAPEETKPESRKLVESYDLGKVSLGESYDILKPGRGTRSALPGEAEMIVVPRSLTPQQVGVVVKEKSAELDYCWQRLAIIDRVPSTAVLKLKIDVMGKVTSLAIGGDAPASVNACLKEAVPHWVFPEAETKSEISYPVAFRSL
ncbi:MAG: hypothetical protein JNL83_12505 [Myxococcales bacterium]|nr:hypothetical protein [Myxococcales bacterium]